MITRDEVEYLNELYQDIVCGLSLDLETGSHHMNNAASDKFNKAYPTLNRAINALGEHIKKQEELFQ